MNDDRFADYRRGIDTGVMKSATPNAMLDCLQEIERLRAAINTVRITTVRTVPTHIAEGPYQDAGLQNVLVGDWNLIKSLQTGDAGERSE